MYVYLRLFENVEVGVTSRKTPHLFSSLVFLVPKAIDYCLALNHFEGPFSLIVF